MTNILSNTNMATSFLCITWYFILLSTPTAIMAADEFRVGGSGGWHQPPINKTEMYAKWAAKKKFHVGDLLRFEYKSDSVEVVDKWGYYHCDSSHPIEVYRDGNTMIILKKPGPIYFISAEPDHCKNGQRLMVDVINQSQPVSRAGSLWVGPILVLFYVVLVAASIV